jgi:hypothetical protein
MKPVTGSSDQYKILYCKAFFSFFKKGTTKIRKNNSLQMELSDKIPA